jgi:hypothetical protein
MCKTGPMFLQEHSVVVLLAMEWSSVPEGTLSNGTPAPRRRFSKRIEARGLGMLTFSYGNALGMGNRLSENTGSVLIGTLHCVTRELASSECSYGNTLQLAFLAMLILRVDFWLRGRVRFSNAVIRKCSYGNTDAKASCQRQQSALTSESIQYKSEKCSYRNTL